MLVPRVDVSGRAMQGPPLGGASPLSRSRSTPCRAAKAGGSSGSSVGDGGGRAPFHPHERRRHPRFGTLLAPPAKATRLLSGDQLSPPQLPAGVRRGACRRRGPLGRHPRERRSSSCPATRRDRDQERPNAWRCHPRSSRRCLLASVTRRRLRPPKGRCASRPRPRRPPPTKDLAAVLGVNTNTVLRAARAPRGRSTRPRSPRRSLRS